MKRKIIWLIIGVIVVGFAAFALTRRQERMTKVSNADHTGAHLSHSSATSPAHVKSVPAHYKAEPAASSLAPTLEPERFTGKTREAYRVVREAPQLIAQLPCYCYCDRGFGHKSLHSCFVDDHAAHCAVCVDEALMAYRLKKEDGLTPTEIRERIIAEYSTP